MKRLRIWSARQVLRLARWIDPDTDDDLARIQRYNENLHVELTREREKRTELTGEIRWLRARVQELETALEARKEEIH